MANYKISVTDAVTGEILYKKDSETIGLAIQYVIEYGYTRVANDQRLVGIEWTINDYTQPKGKGDLIQVYGRLSKIGSPIIKGVATKI